MTKKRVALGIAALLVLGGVACLSLLEGYLLGFTQGHGLRAAFSAYDTALELRLLRKGDTQGAIESLESSLDSDIIRHASYDADLDQRLNVLADGERYDSRVMAYVSAYRTDFPSAESKPIIRSSIARELKKYPPPKCGDSDKPKGPAPTSGAPR